MRSTTLISLALAAVAATVVTIQVDSTTRETAQLVHFTNPTNTYAGSIAISSVTNAAGYLTVSSELRPVALSTPASYSSDYWWWAQQKNSSGTWSRMEFNTNDFEITVHYPGGPFAPPLHQLKRVETPVIEAGSGIDIVITTNESGRLIYTISTGD